MSKNIFNGITNDGRGSIAFFSSYRPPVPLDIYSSPIRPSSKKDEFLMTDGQFYNYSGHEIPSEALKTMLKHTPLGLLASPDDVENGDVSGFMMVSERLLDKLETLYVALSFHKAPTTPRSVLNNPAGWNAHGILQEITNQIRKMQLSKSQVAILPLTKLYAQAFDGVRMEDSACFAGDRYLIFISTMQAAPKWRQPWTAIYKMDLTNGHTIRLTPRGVADFSPSVSPSGEMIAVATLEHKSGGWTGEIEDLKTDIVLMNVKHPHHRSLVIKDGGWPSWGSNNILYFHRKTKEIVQGKPIEKWGVFQADIRNSNPIRITPKNVDAMTPAAIDKNRVVVAIIRDRLDLGQPRKSPDNYRHIEVFDLKSPKSSTQVTRMMNPYTDHHNPFVIWDAVDDDDDDDDDEEDDVLIGYHRSKDTKPGEFQIADVLTMFDKIKLDDPPNVGLYRIPGVYPTFSADGSKLAFVDNDFQNVYLADIRGGLRAIFNVSRDMPQLPEDERSVFSPVWNKDQKQDTLYICVGPAFSATKRLHIYAIYKASSSGSKSRYIRRITDIEYSNNAFPSTNPAGTKMVFRSTRDWLSDTQPQQQRPKNLYILDLSGKEALRRITDGKWIDTHCDWSTNGQWIVFSSTRDKPADAPPLDQGLDPGYYSIYLMKADKSDVLVKVVSSGPDGVGHVNHPFFSPDNESIVFTTDLAAVSVEPISLPLFIHSVRPYGDIFSVDIDQNDINKNKNLTNFKRITHSRYENSTPNWSMFTARNLSNEWINLFKECHRVTNWRCPFAAGAFQLAQLTAANCITPKRCC